jgi:hypothetical protein
MSPQKSRCFLFCPFFAGCASLPTVITQYPETTLINNNFKEVKRFSSSSTADYFLFFQLNNFNIRTQVFNDLYPKAQMKGKYPAIIALTIAQHFFTFLLWYQIRAGKSKTAIEFVNPSQHSNEPWFENEKDEIDKQALSPGNKAFPRI